jgi:hypothetical protein
MRECAMSEPSELTRRIKKLLGELFRFGWEIPGPHAPSRKDNSEAPLTSPEWPRRSQEEKPGERSGR